MEDEILGLEATEKTIVISDRRIRALARRRDTGRQYEVELHKRSVSEESTCRTFIAKTTSEYELDDEVYDDCSANGFRQTGDISSDDMDEDWDYEDAPQSVVPPTYVMPYILIDADEYRVVDEAILALSGDQELFQRHNTLVCVKYDHRQQNSVPVITSLAKPLLREKISKYCLLFEFNRYGEIIHAHPPNWLVSAIHARGEWPGIRHLNGISESPVLRPDGTIWQTPGYDAVTGFFYSPSIEFPVISDKLTQEDASLAAKELLEIICDFQFENIAHKSAWLAALLTPPAKNTFSGPSPLFLFDANVRGAGKSLLVQLIAMITTGRAMPVLNYAHDTEEMRKKITALATAGTQQILLDNIAGKFGNAALDSLLTSTQWQDRVLGSSKLVDLHFVPTMYATGNNIAVVADTSRRLIHIRLNVLEEHPENRSDFKHPNLVDWVSQNRGRLFSNAITILVAYIRAGKPSQPLEAFGSYEEWSSIVRQAIVWAGFPDPCLTRQLMAEESDSTTDALRQLINAWREYDPTGKGLVVSELLADLYPQKKPKPDDINSIAMRAALENFADCAPGKSPTARLVGSQLKEFHQRVIDGVMLAIDKNASRRNGATWRIFHVKGPVA